MQAYRRTDPETGRTGRCWYRSGPRSVGFGPGVPVCLRSFAAKLARRVFPGCFSTAGFSDFCRYRQSVLFHFFAAVGTDENPYYCGCTGRSESSTGWIATAVPSCKTVIYCGVWGSGCRRAGRSPAVECGLMGRYWQDAANRAVSRVVGITATSWSICTAGRLAGSGPGSNGIGWRGNKNKTAGFRVK